MKKYLATILILAVVYLYLPHVHKVYATTNSVYTSVDGIAQRNGLGDQTFATIRAGAGTAAGTRGDPDLVMQMVSSPNSGQWRELNGRSIFCFDVKTPMGTEAATAATFSLFGTSADNRITGQSVVIDKPNPASFTSAPGTSDYNVANWDGVEQSSTRIGVASWSTTGYNDFTINATGISNINTAEQYVCFGARASGDFDDSEPTWSADVAFSVRASATSHTGTSQDPVLVIISSVAAPAVVPENTILFLDFI